MCWKRASECPSEWVCVRGLLFLPLADPRTWSNKEGRGRAAGWPAAPLERIPHSLRAQRSPAQLQPSPLGSHHTGVVTHSQTTALTHSLTHSLSLTLSLSLSLSYALTPLTSLTHSLSLLSPSQSVTQAGRSHSYSHSEDSRTTRSQQGKTLPHRGQRTRQ